MDEPQVRRWFVPAPPLPYTGLPGPTAFQAQYSLVPSFPASPPRFRSSQVSFLPGPTLPRYGSLPTLWVSGSSLKLGCWRRNASTSEVGSSMIGDPHLTPQPPREAERRPGRKQISPSRKCSKMAAMMALAVLRRQMTRSLQWAYAGPVSGGLEKILPKKRDREGWARSGAVPGRTLPKTT